MTIREVLVLGVVLIAIVCVCMVVVNALGPNASGSPTDPIDIPTNSSIPQTSIPLTSLPTEPPELTPPIPDSVITDTLYAHFEYIPNLSKEENLQYRFDIIDYTIYLWSVLSKLDWKAENYLEVSEIFTTEINKLLELDKLYEQDYLEIIQREEEDAKWQKRYEEYPVATKVWLFLKNEMGYSDYVCAGIIGNMMAECGGQTLKLKWDARNKKSNCYGLCQWHPKYYPELQGTTLEEQLEHMRTSFPKTLSRYMDACYKKGFTYEDFLALEDPSEIAYIFCVVYERPGPGSYNVRRENAIKAYEYFTT